MSQQIDNLIKNIDDLTNTVIDIGEKINQLSAIKAPTFTFSEIGGSGTFKFMTNRQIAKKIIMMGGSKFGSAGAQINSAISANTPPQVAGGINATLGQEINSIDEDTAHLMVYGKFLYDANGRLIDNEERFPDCVAKPGQGLSGITHMSNSFPLLQWAKNAKKEFTFAMAGLRIKVGELGQAFIDMQFQLILAVTTLASAVTILPPGSGLPTALSAVKSIPTTLMAFQTRIMQLVPFLSPLSYLEVLIPIDKVDSVLIPINIVLNLIKRPFSVIDTILSLVTALTGATPPVPGVDGEPAEPITVNIIANPTVLPTGNPLNISVNLAANASKGSWQYTYKWTSDPPGFVASTKEVKVIPKATTKYTVKVSDAKDSNNSVTSDITITS